MILVVAILLAVFVLPPEWQLPAIVVAVLLEIGETAFWLWYTRRRDVQVGAETLVGMLAVVVAPCAPLGQVRLQGEIWQARCEEGAEEGESVLVRGLDGLTLLVERAA